MAIFTPYEKEILNKFKIGAEIETKEERKVIDRWARVGFVLRGYDWGNQRGTAKLSDLGIKHLNS